VIATAEVVSIHFGRVVKPHVPDAWIETVMRDHKYGEVGIVGYEVNTYKRSRQPASHDRPGMTSSRRHSRQRVANRLQL
jgi:hypothetical protein